MRNFSSIEPKSESNFPFLHFIRFQTYWSLETLAPLVGEIDICAPRLLCMKFNSEQLLFDAFFDIMRIFGNIKSQSELTFPFHYIITFKIWTFYQPGDITTRVYIGEHCVYTCDHFVHEPVREHDVCVISTRFANCSLQTISRRFFRQTQRMFAAQWVRGSFDFLFSSIFAGGFFYVTNNFHTIASSLQLVRCFPMVCKKFVGK